ncbi:MAG TPA: hypothetical protein VKU91_04420 [Acidimicrobiales bacterium]|nr:hypothetical protein [Acidimicrobiales bacterium]
MPIYGGLALVVLAQIIGIYALVTRKADLVFTIVILAMVAAAAVLAGVGTYLSLR